MAQQGLSEEELRFMREEWSPLSARHCALCVYKEGKLLQKCRPCMQMDFLAQVTNSIVARERVLLQRINLFGDKLCKVMDVVEEQEEDEGLWCQALTCSEGYLQQELRRLHNLIEALATDEPLDKGDLESRQIDVTEKH